MDSDTAFPIFVRLSNESELPPDLNMTLIEFQDLEPGSFYILSIARKWHVTLGRANKYIDLCPRCLYSGMLQDEIKYRYIKYLNPVF